MKTLIQECTGVHIIKKKQRKSTTAKV